MAHVPLLCDAPSAVVDTPYRTPLHMCWMVRPKVEVPVRVRLYIGKTTRRLETRLKEHKDTCIKGFTDKSAIAEYAWNEDDPIRWGDTRILQHASRTMA